MLCPVCSVLYVPFLPVPFFSLSLGLSVLTVLFKLSFCFISWPFLFYYPPIPVLFFLSSLLCSFVLSCSCLSCFYCHALAILYGLLSIQGFYETGIPSCLPCPSLHTFLSSPVFFRFYHSVQYCYLYFLAALYFLDFPVYPLLSVQTLLSCPITPVCVSVSILLSNLTSPSPAITLLSCLHLTQSYFPVLSLAVCPVSCCPSCLLLPVLSPVLSVTPDLFCLRNSAVPAHLFFPFCPGCNDQS